MPQTEKLYAVTVNCCTSGNCGRCIGQTPYGMKLRVLLASGVNEQRRDVLVRNWSLYEPEVIALPDEVLPVAPGPEEPVRGQKVGSGGVIIEVKRVKNVSGGAPSWVALCLLPHNIVTPWVVWTLLNDADTTALYAVSGDYIRESAGIAAAVEAYNERER